MSEKVPMLLLSIAKAQEMRQLLSYTADYLEENRLLLRGDRDVIQARLRYDENLLAKLIDIYTDDPPVIVDNTVARLLQKAEADDE